MTKAEAIAWIKQIQSGDAPESMRDILPKEILGGVAESVIDGKVGDDVSFFYGMEYGVIAGLMKAFDISVEEL